MTIQSGGTGSGPGTIAVTIAANADPAARETSVIVADQSVKFTQAGREACTYRVAPDVAFVHSDGATAVVSVTTASHCPWTAAASDPWIALGVTAGTGSAAIPFTVAEWSGPAERTATIRLAGVTVTIRQSRDPHSCVYAITPLEFTLHWHETGGEVRVTTDADCAWTVRSTAAWLQVPGAESRSGSGTVQFATPAYTVDDTRRAPLELRWPTPSAGQNVWVTQEGCRYGVYPGTVAVGVAGGSQYVNVLTQPITAACSIGCSWSAVSDVSWISIASGSPGAGDDRFRIEIAPNTGGTRSGTVRVGGQTVVVTQAGT